jgi:hypothetical protein
VYLRVLNKIIKSNNKLAKKFTQKIPHGGSGCLQFLYQNWICGLSVMERMVLAVPFRNMGYCLF